jgi:hypothetical protein
MTTATKTKTDFNTIWAEADLAGKAAANAATPTPIVVGTPTTPFGGDIDYSKPTYFVADGLCGFAWVKFKGNTGFGRWAKKSGLARPAYGGGLSYWITVGRQSVAIKEAYAQAFAKVLRDYGIEAYAESRLD